MRKLTAKQKREHAEYEQAREVQLDARLALSDKHNGIDQPAILRWFDALSGEGMVQLEDGTILHAHFSAIEGVDKNNYAYPTETDRDRLSQLGYNVPVIVTPYLTCSASMCEKITIPSLKGIQYA